MSLPAAADVFDLDFGWAVCWGTMLVVGINDEEIVARFVLRARRVEAHSLVQDREAFAELAEEKGTIRLTVDGSGTMTRSLPADEEVFESLAARVRPLVLD